MLGFTPFSSAGVSSELKNRIDTIEAKNPPLLAVVRILASQQYDIRSQAPAGTTHHKFVLVGGGASGVASNGELTGNQPMGGFPGAIVETPIFETFGDNAQHVSLGLTVGSGGPSASTNTSGSFVNNAGGETRIRDYALSPGAQDFVKAAGGPTLSSVITDAQKSYDGISAATADPIFLAGFLPLHGPLVSIPGKGAKKNSSPVTAARYGSGPGSGAGAGHTSQTFGIAIVNGGQGADGTHLSGINFATTAGGSGAVGSSAAQPGQSTSEPGEYGAGGGGGAAHNTDGNVTRNGGAGGFPGGGGGASATWRTSAGSGNGSPSGAGGNGCIDIYFYGVSA